MARIGKPPTNDQGLTGQMENPGIPGFVYVIGQKGSPGPVKIGWSRDPAARLRTLQTASAGRLVVIISCAGTQADEKTLHHRLRHVRKGGEWFIQSQGMLDLIRDMKAGKPLAELGKDARTTDAPTRAALERRQRRAEKALVEKGILPKDYLTNPKPPICRY